MLCSAVKNYISTAKGLPFFYVVGDNDYGTTLEELKQAGLSVVRVSDFCSNKDKFPSMDDITDYFRTSDVDFKTNKCVLVGLGEYLALRGEAEALKVLRKLKYVTLGNARVVLLLRGISPQVSEILKDDIKVVNQQRSFVSGDCSVTLSVTNVQQDMDLVKEKGFRPLLKAFEDGVIGNVIAHTNLNLDNSLFPISVIANAYDAIRYVSKDFSLNRTYGNDEQWSRLCSDLTKCNNSFDALFEKCGYNEGFETDFYDHVAGYEYKNWLFFIALKYYRHLISNSYLLYVLDKTEIFQDFKINVVTAIVDIPHSDIRFPQFYKERKKLVIDFPESDIAVFIHENEVDPQEGIYRLTDNTQVEREAIIRLIAQIGLHPVISTIYPALDMYLKKYVFACGGLSSELTAYFENYKKQKVTNDVSDEFLSDIQKYALSMRYAQLDMRDNALMSITDKENTRLCWIDALGVEYLSYITELARIKGLSVHIDVARSELPTITSINRRFFDEWQGGAKFKISELDDIKHKEAGGFNYVECSAPVHLASELAVIEKVMSQAATDLAMHTCKKFVIASDHGASRMAVIHHQEEKYETDTKGEHSGRCCKIFDGYDLPFAIPENGYIVLADYGRFKGSRAANVEVHGGASLEEVVVPIITLTLKRESAVVVKLLNADKIYADRHNGTTISIYVSDAQHSQNVSVVLNGNRYNAQATDKTHFTIHLHDIKRSKKYFADVYDDNDLIGKIEISVKGKTATVNDDFDDLF